MPTVQNAYNERHSAAQLGMIADTRGHKIRSMTYEGAANLAFGLALTFTANDNGADFGGTKFAGISVMSQTNDPGNSGSQDVYRQNDTVPLVHEGSIWVTASVAVAPGDPVHFIAATGVLTNTGGIAISGAVWETNAAIGELSRIAL